MAGCLSFDRADALASMVAVDGLLNSFIVTTTDVIPDVTTTDIVLVVDAEFVVLA